MLFDLQVDISEQHNVAQQHPDIVRELSEAIAEWEVRIASGTSPKA
jgi:hypothetical protein